MGIKLLNNSTDGFLQWHPTAFPTPPSSFGEEEPYDIPDDYEPVPMPEPEPEPEPEPLDFTPGDYQDLSDENWVHIHFPTFSDLRRAEPPEQNKKVLGYIFSNKDDRGRWLGTKWWGVDSVEELLSLIDGGWSEGLERIRDIVRQLKGHVKRPPGKRRRKRRGEFGDELDIHSVYRGDLNRAWTRTQTVEPKGMKEGRKVSVVMEMSTSAVIDSAKMFWRPATALALTELLVKAGYSVELIAAKTSRQTFSDFDGPSNFIGTVVLKTFNQTINSEILAATALGGFYRTYGFKTLCCVPNRKASKSMGYAANMPLDSKFIKSRGGKVIYIKNVWSEMEAIQFIKKELSPLT